MSDQRPWHEAFSDRMRAARKRNPIPFNPKTAYHATPEQQRAGADRMWALSKAIAAKPGHRLTRAEVAEIVRLYPV